MTAIATISELLKLSDCQYRLYDIGRKITKISKDDFNKIEQNQLAYPFPSQGHAHLAIAFWQPKSTQPYLWFVKLPLDERGLLNQGARNHFIAIIVEALGNDLSVDPTEQQEELLKSNPYHFTPAGYKLSALNSLLKVELKQPASIHYEAVQEYIAGQHPWQDWHKLGLQGLSDYAARLEQGDNLSQLVKHFQLLPKQVLLPLCTSLENQALNYQLIDVIIQRVNQPIDEETQLHLLRSLASSCDSIKVTQLVESMLAKNSCSAEVIITLSSRCWQVLADDNLLIAFMEQLVRLDDQPLFAAIFKDLVAIPQLRPNIFSCMRSPKRSEALGKAIGLLFNQQ